MLKRTKDGWQVVREDGGQPLSPPDLPRRQAEELEKQHKALKDLQSWAKKR